MLTTSVSLPAAAAVLWRRSQRQIFCMALRVLRIRMRGTQVRRGVTRSYNSAGGEYCIVTTRMTEAEYDTLHFVAATLRVSVSSLIFLMIQLWRKKARRKAWSKFLTNYEVYECKWNEFAGVLTEALLFYPKTRLTNTSRISKPIT